jgi:hypothetical protein
MMNERSPSGPSKTPDGHLTRRQVTHGLVDEVTRDELDALYGALDKLAAYTPGERGGSDGWGRLLALASVADQVQALMVHLAAHVSEEGVVESREGLPAELGLGLLAQMTTGDRKTLLAAGDVLSTMPRTFGAFTNGDLSWSQTRTIVSACRRLTVAERSEVDRAVADGLTRMAEARHPDPDVIVAEVDRLIDRLRPHELEKSRKAGYEGQFLNIQLGLDGSSRWYAEYDPTSTAAMLEAVETKTARNRTRTDSHLHDKTKEDAWPAWRRRGRDRAHALNDICHDYLAGGEGDGPARPSMLVLADAETVSGEGDKPGELLWRLPHGPVTLSARQIRELACHADKTIILKNGDRIIGLYSSSDKTPEALRQMVVSRDHHCRAPGCRNPIEVIHHVEYPGGPTRVTRQAGLCRTDHYRVHHDDWTLDMTDDGVCTWRRGRRTFTTHPADHRRIQPPEAERTQPPGDPPPGDLPF